VVSAFRACEHITFNAETAEPAEKCLMIFQRVLRVLRLTSSFSALILLLAPLLAGACRSEPPRPQTKEVVVWRQVGSWSGRGDRQTETFTSDTGGFRVHWDTKHEAPPEAGRLRVVFRSGDSGREIIEAIDARGAGSGVEEVAAERPRWYFLTIESANVDWTVTVDERIEAQTSEK
jgi:hypothetical protein